MAKSILLLNGPNLNLLGTREPHLYGSTTLSDVESSISTYLSSHNPPVAFSSFQSNHEGALIDRIHEARGTIDAIIINAGGLTHTSVALRDALAGVDIPFVEVHVTNVHARESFRHLSFLSEKAAAVICGLGTYGYKAAAEFCIEHLKVRNRS
ncbi:Dehydroquinase [Xylogone sp. PMI_703]|nr:Dehydroquinase [Xylogone sp. PMI_703]